MERKHLSVILLLLIIVSSCSAPKYVPQVEELPLSTHGSHIEVQQKSKAITEGELIAIDSTGLVILAGIETKQLRNITFDNIEKFKLTYAQPKNYGWTIPVYTAATISHGIFLIFTAPVNIAVTSVVASAGANAFTYNQKVISYEELRMFARFPQGIPPNIDPANIR